MTVCNVEAGALDERPLEIYNNEESFETLEQKVYGTFVQTFTDYTVDSTQRMREFRSNPCVLLKGVFYANEHFLAMEEAIAIQSKIVESVFADYNSVKDELKIDPDSDALKKKLQDLQRKFLAENAKKVQLTTLFLQLFQGNDYYNGYRNPEFFDKVPSFTITGFAVNCFAVKKGSLPSDVLTAYKTGLTLTDCNNTIVAAYYQTLCNLWGEEKFNLVFATDSCTPISFNLQSNPIRLFLKGDGKPVRLSGNIHQRDLKIGHRYYISNVSTYTNKHFNGESQGFNLVCIADKVGEQKFVGFGLAPEGVDEDEVNEALISMYNADPIGDKIVTEALKSRFSYANRLANKLKNRVINLDAYREAGGGEFSTIDEALDVQKIKQVIDTPIEDLRSLVDALHQEYESTVAGDSLGNSDGCIVC